MQFIIETKRLILRPPKAGDEILLNACICGSLPDLLRWMPWAKDPSLESTLYFINEGINSWASENQRDFPMIIIDKETGQPIGATGFNDRSKPEIPLYEIGYWVDTAHAGKGFCTEAVKALTEYALNTLKAVRLQIAIQVGNEASRRVAEKCGFELEVMRKNNTLDCLTGKPADDWLFVRFG